MLDTLRRLLPPVMARALVHRPLPYREPPSLIRPRSHRQRCLILTLTGLLCGCSRLCTTLWNSLLAFFWSAKRSFAGWPALPLLHVIREVDKVLKKACATLGRVTGTSPSKYHTATPIGVGTESPLGSCLISASSLLTLPRLNQALRHSSTQTKATVIHPRIDQY